MFFYLATPFVVFCLNRLGAGQYKHIGLAFGVISYAALFLVCFMVVGPNPPFSNGWWLLYIFPPVRAFDYFVGASAALYFGAANFRGRQYFCGHFVLSTFVEIGAIFGLLASLWLSTRLPVTGMAFSAVYLPSFCLLIVVFAIGEGLISKVLSLKLFVHLGEISFSLYMVHALVNTILTRYYGPALYQDDPAHPKLAATVVAIAVSLAFSDMLYRYVEMPVRKWAREHVRPERAMVQVAS